MTRFLEFIQPDLARLSLGGILSDIRTSMMEEVDFTKVGVMRVTGGGGCGSYWVATNTGRRFSESSTT